MRTYFKLIFCPIIISLMFLGCSKAVDDTLKFDDSIINTDRNANSTWEGKYEFFEHADPDINMEYTISVCKESESYFANISIDGFQTAIRAKSKVIGNQDSIDLIFEVYLPDNMNERFEKDDVILNLKRVDSKISTYWGKLTPVLYENMDSGKIYFEKVEEYETSSNCN